MPEPFAPGKLCPILLSGPTHDAAQKNHSVRLMWCGGRCPGNPSRVPHLRPPAFQLDTTLTGHWQVLVAGLGWVLFSLYWEIAAKSAAAAKSSESQTSRGIHVFLANAALLLEIVPIRGLGRFLPASSVVMAAGIAVEAKGLCLAIWSRRHLGRNWSGEITIKVEHQLIRSGPYKLLRHPI
jgi:hypothetical protein